EAAVPALAKLLEAFADLLVAGHVQRQDDVAAEAGRGLLDPRAQLVVEIGERQFRALAMHRLGDAAGDRAVAGDAGDECALALQETHGYSSVTVRGRHGRAGR